MNKFDPVQAGKHFKLFKNIDPKLYNSLLVLIDQKVTDRMHEVSTAPPDQILVAQGRAQEAMSFLRLMHELPEEDPPAQPASPGP